MAKTSLGRAGEAGRSRYVLLIVAPPSERVNERTANSVAVLVHRFFAAWFWFPTDSSEEVWFRSTGPASVRQSVDSGDDPYALPAKVVFPRLDHATIRGFYRQGQSRLHPQTPELRAPEVIIGQQLDPPWQTPCYDLPDACAV
jgi:hypothetical protein